MRAIVLERPEQFRLGACPDVTDVPPGHALVRVHRVGVCGTDWHAWRGRQPFFAYPRILGHELGVVVEQVNAGASPLRPGDRCSVEPYLNCGQCIACRRGRGNCCTALRVLGVHIDGGMRDRLLVPAHKLHRSQRLSVDQLALVETLAIGCHGVSRAAPEPSEFALIIGAGPIGLSAIPFAQAAGARVAVMDISAERLEFCRARMRVEHTIDGGGDVPAALKQLGGGDLPTVVIDATGNPQSMARTFECVAHGGRIVFVGLFQGQVTFDDPNFHRREITLLASRNALPGDFGRIIRLMEEGRIDTTPWVTHRAGPEEFVDRVAGWSKAEAKVLKAMVEFA